MNRTIRTNRQWQRFRYISRIAIMLLICLMLVVIGTASAKTGDIDNNDNIDLADAITGLKILVNANLSEINKDADVNGDNRIGLEEVIYVLQFIVLQDSTEDVANSNVVMLSTIERETDNLKEMTAVLNYIGLNTINPQQRELLSIQDIVTDLLALNFTCGNISQEGLITIIFTFTGETDCGGITGTIKITPSLSSENLLSYKIEYENIQKDDCVINGNATMTLSFETGVISANHTFNEMTICGQEIDGDVVITYDTEGQILSISKESENTYTINDSPVTVQANYTYEETGISGTATITTDNETYNSEFNDIKVDTTCGVPTSGLLTINDIQFDFSDTSCDNPEVAVNLYGITLYMSLEDAKNLFQSIYQETVGPTARNAALKTVDSCEILLNDFKEKAIAEMEVTLEQNLEYALQWGGCAWYPVYEDIDANVITGGEAPSSEKGATEYSETNTQVSGVDEADFVKNDSTYIYMLADNKFHIVKAWVPEESTILSSFDIEGDPKKMFVHNQRALIYSSLDYVRPQDYAYDPYDYYYINDDECTYGYNCDFTGDGRKLKITILDITTKGSPELIREIYFNGAYLNSRRIQDAVHSVVIFPEPEINGVEYWPEELQCSGYYWWDYDNSMEKEYTDAEINAMFDALRQKNIELIQSAEITDWLPSVKDIRYTDGQAEVIQEGILGNCDEYYISMQEDGNNFLSIASLNINGAETLNPTTIIGRPGAVYASSSALYVSSRHEQSGIYWFFDEEEGIEEASTVHKFTLNNDTPSSVYSGSGAVKGRVLNQFSMDEYEGFFRIATTTGHVPSPDVHSTISVFKDNGNGELAVIGQIDNIAPTEDIRSARFDEDKGYIVTFKKTDPLFVFDLSTPDNPKIAGELKIPGFSTYMHRIDENHLLTIGYDAEDYETYALFQGIMLQIFDVADMTQPSLLYKEIIGTRGSTSDAATNHLAFNFFKPKDMLAIPMTICEGGTGGSMYGTMMTFSGLMLYKVKTDTGFEYLGGISHQEPETEETYRGACSNWWTDSNSWVKRSIFMDDYLFSITKDEIKVNHISALGTDIAVIRLSEE